MTSPKRERENKCSNEPQAVSDYVWYYEFPSNIEVHVQRGDAQTVILIPRRKLEASLKRMNASRKAAGSGKQ